MPPLERTTDVVQVVPFDQSLRPAARRGRPGSLVVGDQLTLNTFAITRVLGIVVCALLVADAAAMITKYVFGHTYAFGFVPLFDLDGETNIPTYFSQLLLLGAGFLLAIIGLLNKVGRRPHTLRWAVLSAGFFYLSYDEAFQIHEQLVVPVRALLGTPRARNLL